MVPVAADFVTRCHMGRRSLRLPRRFASGRKSRRARGARLAAHRLLSGRLLVLDVPRAGASGADVRDPRSATPRRTTGDLVIVAVRPERKLWWRSFAGAAAATVTLRGAPVGRRRGARDGSARATRRSPRMSRATARAARLVAGRGGRRLHARRDNRADAPLRRPRPVVPPPDRARRTTRSRRRGTGTLILEERARGARRCSSSARAAATTPPTSGAVHVHPGRRLAADAGPHPRR